MGNWKKKVSGRGKKGTEMKKAADFINKAAGGVEISLKKHEMAAL
jgi:hypothetical protein